IPMDLIRNYQIFIFWGSSALLVIIFKSQ
ncbi:hypothetical protein CISIN_1g0202551mg, partial [Citrus sinensis]